MKFVLAIAEDQVPSTHEPDPYMHLFMDAGNGNILAFFEIPNSPAMGRDPNTPSWVQHIAFKVDSEAVALAERLAANAHATVADRFTVDRMVCRYDRLFADCLR